MTTSTPNILTSISLLKEIVHVPCETAYVATIVFSQLGYEGLSVGREFGDSTQQSINQFLSGIHSNNEIVSTETYLQNDKIFVNLNVRGKTVHDDKMAIAQAIVKHAKQGQLIIALDSLKDIEFTASDAFSSLLIPPNNYEHYHDNNNHHHYSGTLSRRAFYHSRVGRIRERARCY